MDRQIRLPVENLVVRLTDGGGTVSSDLDHDLVDIKSSLMSPDLGVAGVFEAARRDLYETLLADAKSGIDLTSDAYVAGVRAAIDAFSPYRPYGRRWGYP